MKAILQTLLVPVAKQQGQQLGANVQGMSREELKAHNKEVRKQAKLLMGRG